MINWERNKRLLVDGSEKAIRDFLAQHGDSELCAIGYVFELCNYSPAFDLCANTRRYYLESVERYRQQSAVAQDDIRWNSGEFEFPAGLNGHCELGPDWCAEADSLHAISNYDEDGNASEYLREVYDGLIRISCETLAELANRGLFGDWSRIDFNVADVGDQVEIVKRRDRAIREMIRGKLDLDQWQALEEKAYRTFSGDP